MDTVISVTSARTCDMMVDMSVLNLSDYRHSNSTVVAEQSDADMFRSIREDRKERLAAERDEAAAGLAKLAPKFAALGVEVRASGGAPESPHTYEIFSEGERLLWWWPSSGKTRWGQTAGKRIGSAQELLDVVRKLTDKSLLNSGAFAKWLAERVPGSRAWLPRRGDDFARLYIGQDYVHIAPSVIGYKNASPALETSVKALLDLYQVKKGFLGFVIGRHLTVCEAEEAPTVA